MSLDYLLPEPVVLLRRSAGTEDDHGNASDVFTEVGTYKGRLEQRSAEERTLNRDTQLSDWVLYLHPDVVLTARDRIVDEFLRTFEIVGAPAMEKRPAGRHHLVVSLRYVSD